MIDLLQPLLEFGLGMDGLLDFAVKLEEIGCTLLTFKKFKMSENMHEATKALIQDVTHWSMNCSNVWKYSFLHTVSKLNNKQLYQVVEGLLIRSNQNLIWLLKSKDDILSQKELCSTNLWMIMNEEEVKGHWFYEVAVALTSDDHNKDSVKQWIEIIKEAIDGLQVDEVSSTTASTDELLYSVPEDFSPIAEDKTAPASLHSHSSLKESFCIVDAFSGKLDENENDHKSYEELLEPKIASIGSKYQKSSLKKDGHCENKTSIHSKPDRNDYGDSNSFDDDPQVDQLNAEGLDALSEDERMTNEHSFVERRSSTRAREQLNNTNQTNTSILNWLVSKVPSLWEFSLISFAFQITVAVTISTIVSAPASSNESTSTMLSEIQELKHKFEALQSVHFNQQQENTVLQNKIFNIEKSFTDIKLQQKGLTSLFQDLEESFSIHHELASGLQKEIKHQADAVSDALEMDTSLVLKIANLHKKHDTVANNLKLLFRFLDRNVTDMRHQHKSTAKKLNSMELSLNKSASLLQSNLLETHSLLAKVDTISDDLDGLDQSNLSKNKYKLNKLSKEVDELEDSLEKVTDFIENMSPHPLGMEDGRIKDSQISSSSYSYGNKPQFARLNTQSSMLTAGWSAAFNDKNPWIQVDFERPVLVGGLVTQGGSLSNEWTTAYRVSYGMEADELMQVVDDKGHTKVFKGNFDDSTKVKNIFYRPVRTRFVRIHPVTWNNKDREGHYTPDLRFEVLGF